MNDFRNYGKKKKMREHFVELLGEIWYVCRYCINVIYVLCKDFFSVDMRRY